MGVPRIASLHLEGFRKFQRPVDFALRRPDGEPLDLAVFAGPNGSGKTSVLEAILLVLGREDLIERDLPANLSPEEREGQHWRLQVAPGGRIWADISLDGGPVERWERTWEGIRCQRRPGGEWVRPAQAMPGELAVEYFSSWRAPLLVGPVKPLKRGPKPLDNQSNRLWRLKQRLSDEKARLGYQPSSTSKISSWLDRLNRAWHDFHWTQDTRLDVQLVDEKTEDIYADVFLMQDDRRVCSVDQLSSGEIEFISLASFIVLNEFHSGLFLIDEPELHLHREWQSGIVPALRRLAPDAQLIVATHADAPWDQAFSFERILLVSTDDPRRGGAIEPHGVSADAEPP